jgi:hypothetical protein
MASRRKEEIEQRLGTLEAEYEELLGEYLLLPPEDLPSVQGPATNDSFFGGSAT